MKREDEMYFENLKRDILSLKAQVALVQALMVETLRALSPDAFDEILIGIYGDRHEKALAKASGLPAGVSKEVFKQKFRDHKEQLIELIGSAARMAERDRDRTADSG